MGALPLVPDFLEWYLAISVFCLGLFFFIASSSGKPPTGRKRLLRIHTHEASAGGRRPSGPRAVGGEREGAQLVVPSRVKRRQSRARIKRMSREQYQENQARLRLHRAGLLVMAGKDSKKKGL